MGIEPDQANLLLAAMVEGRQCCDSADGDRVIPAHHHRELAFFED